MLQEIECEVVFSVNLSSAFLLQIIYKQHSLHFTTSLIVFSLVILCYNLLFTSHCNYETYLTRIISEYLSLLNSLSNLLVFLTN